MLLKIAKISFGMGIGAVGAFALLGISRFYSYLKGRAKND